MSKFGDAATGIASGIGQLMLAINQIGFDPSTKIAESSTATPATLQMIGDLLASPDPAKRAKEFLALAEASAKAKK